MWQTSRGLQFDSIPNRRLLAVPFSGHVVGLTLAHGRKKKKESTKVL